MSENETKELTQDQKVIQQLQGALQQVQHVLYGREQQLLDLHGKTEEWRQSHYRLTQALKNEDELETRMNGWMRLYHQQREVNQDLKRQIIELKKKPITKKKSPIKKR